MASAAHAQTVPLDDRDITVTARKESTEKTARKFIVQVLDATNGQLARFYDKVCLDVVGLPPAMREKFVARFDAVATTVRVPLATGKCTTNLMVLFVADTDNFMTLMKTRYAGFFSDLGDVNRLAALKPGAIRSWRQLEMRDYAGNRMLPDSKVENTQAFETPLHTRTVTAFVVMDRPTIVGKSIWQLADYAAMRALAGATPPEKGAIKADSILSLFDPGVSPSPKGLTDMDLILLGGLYSMKPATTDADGYSQAVGIADQMTRPAKKK